GGDRLPADPGHQAPDAGLRAQRLAGRTRGVDRREVPHLERLRRRRREALHEGRAADERHDLLGDPVDHLVDAPLLRDDALGSLRSGERTGRGADRLRDLSEGALPRAARVGRARLQRAALDAHAARRPLRGARGAGAARRGRAQLLPRSAGVSQPVALVTGASRGIGRQLAADLAAAGYNVVFAARSTAARPGALPGTLEETAALVEKAG